MEDLFYIGYCKTSQVINRCIYFILFLFLVRGVFLVGKKIESKEEEKQLQYEYLQFFFLTKILKLKKPKIFTSAY